MRRRQALQAVGTSVGIVVTAGCLGSELDRFRTEGNDEDPIGADPEELLLPMGSLSEVLASGWSEMDRDSLEESMFHDANAARGYIPYEEDGGFHVESGYVSTGVWVFDEVETAREFYRDHPYQDGWGFEDREIAVESMAGSGTKPSQFRVVFRDANGIGGLQYENERIEDDARERRGLELAVLMHERWRTD